MVMCSFLFTWYSLLFYKYKKVTSLNGELYQEYCPAISGRYWYFISYFGMFIFLPVINKGIQDLTKPEFQLVVISIFGIFTFWYNYINSKSDFFSMKSGNSKIWLLCLYIMGSYIGKFHIGYIEIKKYKNYTSNFNHFTFFSIEIQRIFIKNYFFFWSSKFFEFI